MALMSGLTGSEAEANWRRRWPDGLRSIVLNAVSLIEDELLEYLHQENRTDELDDRLDQRVKFEVRQDVVYEVCFTPCSKKRRKTLMAYFSNFRSFGCLYVNYILMRWFG